MQKEVKIIIETTQIADGEPHTMKYVQHGQYYLKNGQHYIFYEENVEGSRDKIRNRITFSETSMQVSKKGALTSEMYFETGKECNMQYQTPFGAVQMKTKTNAYSMKLREDEAILLLVNYDLSAESGQIAQCHMQIKIQQK